MEVFIEVLELFVQAATLEPNTEHVQSFNIDFHVKKHSKRFLVCE
jgi:hypothetical protein